MILAEELDIPYRLTVYVPVGILGLLQISNVRGWEKF